MDPRRTVLGDDVPETRYLEIIRRASWLLLSSSLFEALVNMTQADVFLYYDEYKYFTNKAEAEN